MQVKHEKEAGNKTLEKMHNELQLRLCTLFPSDDFEFMSLMYTTRKTIGAIPPNAICYDIWGIDSFVQPFGSLNVLDEKTYFC